MSEKIIEFDKVVAGYTPSLTILNELTLDARKAEITLLIGPNGAGKSTVLKTLFGMLVPRTGEVRFEGKRINGKSQRELLAEGIAFVPQGRNLFGSLSGGQQKLVEIARALMLDPRLILMDEPSMGLDPKARHQVFETVAELNEGGRTVLLVEQNARAGLAISSFGAVMDQGRVALAGPAAGLLDDPRVGELYLGGAVAAHVKTAA